MKATLQITDENSFGLRGLSRSLTKFPVSKQLILQVPQQNVYITQVYFAVQQINIFCLLQFKKKKSLFHCQKKIIDLHS